MQHPLADLGLNYKFSSLIAFATFNPILTMRIELTDRYSYVATQNAFIIHLALYVGVIVQLH